MLLQVSDRTNALKSFARLNKIAALISCVWRMPCRHCILGREKKRGNDALLWRYRDKTGGSETMFDRITFDPQIMGGRACIRGMRIPVSVIVGQIAHRATFDEILEGYPDLVKEDIQQAVEYAAWLTQEEIHFR
jgi:uncharacterized protein (DUF433 family)